MADAPAVRKFRRPCAGEIPSAYVHAHTGLRGVDCTTYGGIALAFVKRQLVEILPGVATAEIHLDEIKIVFTEIVVCVFLVMKVEADSYAEFVLVPEAAARVRAAVRVYAGL